MKTNAFKNITLSMLTFFVAVTLLASCSKKNDSKPGGAGSTNHKVVYKATTSDGAVNIVEYTNDQGDLTENTSLNAATFTSPEITISSSIGAITFAATGSGGKSTSTFTVQIYVDGKLVKSNTSTGANLSAATSYIF